MRTAFVSTPNCHRPTVLQFPFQSRPARESWKLLAVCLLPLLAVLPLTLRDRAESSMANFDEELLKKTKQSAAEVVFIGNSMLDTRMDRALWREISLPNKSHFLSVPGSRTLAYYCLLKNFASQMKHPPKLVILFYRDYDFHRLDDHIDGIHLTRLRELMVPEDEPLLHRARGGLQGSGKWKDVVVENLLPEKTATHFRKKVKELAYDVAALGSKEGDDAVEQAVQDTFLPKNFRKDAAEDGASEESGVGVNPQVFNGESTASLLPEFLTLARSMGAKLCFYRVKKRPNAENVTFQTKAVQTYTSEFKAWAEKNGCVLVDESQDPALTLAMYHDGDHLGEHAKAEYTKLFLERMKFLLPRAVNP